MDNEAAEFTRIRDAAMESDDLNWAKKMIPNASCDYVVEMAFHKTRINVLSVSDAKRRESMIWLADRNLRDLFGNPIKRDDPIPL